MAKKKTYSIHLIVILIAISLPMLLSLKQEEGSMPNLTGLVLAKEKPKYSSQSWFDGSYQELMDNYNNDHWFYKEQMVRLNNQFYYNAFNQIRVNGFVIGKEDYLYSEGYIFSVFGDDLVPESKVNDLMMKAKIIQDTLKKKGIDLLFVYAPGKGKYCEEFIEDKYKHPVTKTNHDLFVELGNKHKINQLDLYSYFQKLKPTTPYPLFPKFGHHWSYYGECIAVDTLIAYMEWLHNTDMPDMTWENIEVIDSARSRDADVLKSMNLMWNPNQNMKLAYPEVMFENDSAKNKTRVLTISDSYWYGPVYMGVPSQCFAGGQFWYYYNKVVPSPVPGQKVEVWELDLKQSIESNQIIMLLYSDGNLPAFGNEFINDAYELYTNPEAFSRRMERHRQIQTYAKQIRENPVLLKNATQYSKANLITLDSAIKTEAMKMAGLINK
ncbi:MAG: hypothetical protein AB7O73_07210 [Bacteroidia bacterium]